MKRLFALLALAAVMPALRSQACTGITLSSKDGRRITARTIEWGGSNLHSRYVVVPRGHKQRSLTPQGDGGMSFTARYGYVGLAVETEEFVAEGLNEHGLSAGLFYFPGQGGYEKFDPEKAGGSIADLQLVSWILGCCKTVDEVRQAISEVTIISADPRASTVDWRFADASGRQIVLEVMDAKPVFYENELGVLTNSPSFDWQMTNLNNYVNLYPGPAPSHDLGPVTLAQFGAGGGMLGVPGDVTPPSRFVRAAFYQTSAPQQPTAEMTVRQCFQILNNFDIPIGIEYLPGKVPPDIPSATQWTSATDMAGRRIYYRTMWNSAIRLIDLNAIDFSNVEYTVSTMDEEAPEPIIQIRINSKR